MPLPGALDFAAFSGFLSQLLSELFSEVSLAVVSSVFLLLLE